MQEVVCQVVKQAVVCKLIPITTKLPPGQRRGHMQVQGAFQQASMGVWG